MTKQEIESKLRYVFLDTLGIESEGLDSNAPIWMQSGIDELDILEFLMRTDEELGTNLFLNDEDIDLLKVTFEEIVTLVKCDLER